MTHIGVWAKVGGTVFGYFARQKNSWKIFIRRDLNEGIRFVVAPADIVVRLDLVDEVALNDQGLTFTGRGDVIDMVNGRHQEACFHGKSELAAEIRADTLGQVARFSDVDNATGVVPH